MPASAPAIDDLSKPVPFWEKWSPEILLQLALIVSVCLIGINELPNRIWDPSIAQFTYVIGTLGMWRYSWWFTHVVRARVYGHLVYPRLASVARELWDTGWRPRHMHFMMTTFREDRQVTEHVVRGIVTQIREAGVPGTIWLGSGDIYDERLIEDHLRLIASDLDITLRIVRQNVSGKRIAISLVLRAMSRGDVRDDDIVTFMDGDFVIAPGALKLCLPLFAADPGLEALTTHEAVLVRNVWWMQSFLNMRFAQRHMVMQSHALSGRVLTLTGRMSVFRARHVKTNEFIRLLEADYLDNWLWGRFRFLSGDDKSTWYYMLKHGCKMLYVPDATGYTIEIVKGSPYTRMVENLRRWSGNMLRNGARAIKLGPWRMPLFIWWCLVDQRIAMWTMLISPTLAVVAGMINGLDYLASYIVYLTLTRVILSLVFFSYARRIDLNFIWILYVDQLVNASVKVFIIWRLAQQKWANRGDQKAGFSGLGWPDRLRKTMAAYMTALSVTCIVLATVSYTQIIYVPGWNAVRALLFR
jgi:glycosyltransferase Alg8